MTYKEAYYKALALVRQWRATAEGWKRDAQEWQRIANEAVETAEEAVRRLQASEKNAEYWRQRYFATYYHPEDE
jgi:uncharacterized NAD(P)/FAD-binding protein YdhS